jgi:hypothetical protein
MRRRVALHGTRVLAAALLGGVPRPGLAWFESAAVGARALSVGQAFVSVADDASALYWNPAGLVQLPQHEAMLSYEQPLDLDGLRGGFAAAVLHTRPLSFGLGWQHQSLADAAREDLVYIGLAHTAVRRSLGAFVSAGATLKLAHVGLDRDAFADVPGLSGGQTRWTADLGLLLVPIPNVTAGVAVRNLGRPQFDLLEGGERTTLQNETEWGVSLRWREDAWLHVARVRHPGGDAVTKLGAEMRIAGVLDVRAGYGREQVTGGVGIGWSGWQLDSAFRVHDALGVLYRVGLRRGFGPQREAIGGSFDDF